MRSSQKNFIHILITIMGTLLLTELAWADDPFNGLYIGLSAEALQVDGNFNTNTTVTYPNLNDTGNQLFLTQNANAWQGVGAASALVGYGGFVNNSNLYFSTEAFFEMWNPGITLSDQGFHSHPNSDLDQQTLTTANEVALRDVAYGIDVRPGYLFDTSLLLYGRGGVAFNQLQMTSDTHFAYTNLGVSPSVTYNSPLNMSTTKSVVAWRLGLGVEYALINNFTVGVDYLYTDYDSIKLNGSAAVTTTTGGAPVVTPNALLSSPSVHVYTQSLMVGCKYYMG